MPQRVVCLYCEKVLHWEQGWGWVHPNGLVYVLGLDGEGVLRADHAALPYYPGVPDEPVVKEKT